MYEHVMEVSHVISPTHGLPEQKGDDRDCRGRQLRHVHGGRVVHDPVGLRRAQQTAWRRREKDQLLSIFRCLRSMVSPILLQLPRQHRGWETKEDSTRTHARTHARTNIEIALMPPSGCAALKQFSLRCCCFSHADCHFCLPQAEIFCGGGEGRDFWGVFRRD